jgi:hypothetical protein
VPSSRWVARGWQRLDRYSQPGRRSNIENDIVACQKLENLHETWIWPRLAKGRPPNAVALLAFFEKLGKFRLETAECS